MAVAQTGPGPEDAPKLLDDVTFTMHGAPQERGLVVKLGDFDLIDNVIVEDIEIRAGGGDPLVRVTVSIDVTDVDLKIHPYEAVVSSRTYSLLRRLGWAPPPARDIPAHQFVREQPNMCTLAIGPQVVCGKAPTDPVHGGTQ